MSLPMVSRPKVPIWREYRFVSNSSFLDYMFSFWLLITYLKSKEPLQQIINEKLNFIFIPHKKH